MTTGERILFIDRDGTIIEEPPDEQVDSLHKLRLLPGVIPALLELQRAGYRLVLVSNQDGLGTASFPEPSFREPHHFLRTLLDSQGIAFDAEFFCPHFPADGCDCRKPRTGLLTEFLAEHALDVVVMQGGSVLHAGTPEKVFASLDATCCFPFTWRQGR